MVIAGHGCICFLASFQSNTFSWIRVYFAFWKYSQQHRFLFQVIFCTALWEPLLQAGQHVCVSTCMPGSHTTAQGSSEPSQQFLTSATSSKSSGYSMPGSCKHVAIETATDLTNLGLKCVLLSHSKPYLFSEHHMQLSHGNITLWSCHTGHLSKWSKQKPPYYEHWQHFSQACLAFLILFCVHRHLVCISQGPLPEVRLWISWRQS